MTIDIEALLAPDIQNFITARANDDVAQLALKKPPVKEWPYKDILDQIKARQKASHKIPLWLTHHKDIIFPPSNIIEQASSAATARYKASLVTNDTFADLTGGAGVDSCALTEHFKSGFCIEKDKQLAQLLAHNLPLLSKTPINVIHADAEDFIKTMNHVDLIYVDPQRRDQNTKGKVAFAQCTPDISKLLPKLKHKTRYVLVKASPMMDIQTGINELKNVKDIHIVEYQKDCKELLFLIDLQTDTAPEDINIKCVSLDDDGQIEKQMRFKRKEEERTIAHIEALSTYVYEPGPAFMKSGGFNTISALFDVKKLNKNTHLYTSKTLNKDFPGRAFKVVDTYPVQRKALPLKKANLSVRNFPEKAEILSKKLGLKDGGDDYLFACVDKNNKKILIHCKKAH